MATHSVAYLLEQKRLGEIRARTAVLRALRESQPAPKRRKREPVIAESDWYDDVLDVVRRINSYTFTLAEVYEYADELEKKHPGCEDARPAIRHNLQKLREADILYFYDRGCYTNLELERARTASHK